MKQVILFTMMFLLTTQIHAQKPTDDFSGKWKTEDNHIITITKSGDAFNGYSEKNILILEDIVFNNDKWTGTIYDPKKGIKASCSLILEGDTLKIEAWKGIFSKTIYWEKQTS